MSGIALEDPGLLEPDSHLQLSQIVCAHALSVWGGDALAAISYMILAFNHMENRSKKAYFQGTSDVCKTALHGDRH